MRKFEVTIFCIVPAFKSMTIEADTAEEAQKLALEEDREDFKRSRSAGMSYDCEWGERDNVEINEVREIVWSEGRRRFQP
jgi:hypothetical protein